MVRKLLVSIIVLVASLGWCVSAWAVELDKLSLEDQGKKLILRFEFSNVVEYSKLSYFDANFLSLEIKGLKLTNKQLRKNQLVANDEQFPYYKYVSLRNTDGGGEIRVYMGKRTSPADALPVNNDTFIEVEIIKPFWNQPAPADEDEPLEEPNGEAEDSFIPDTTEAEPEAAPDTSDTGETDQPTEEWPDFDPSERPDGREPGPATDEAVGTPVLDLSIPERVSYRDIDFDAILIPPIRLVDVPFRQALMEMVAEAGYNVVVGSDLDNTSVVLDFRQQQMSLKEAFDVMRLAYDVEYLIEDYSIVFRKK